MVPMIATAYLGALLTTVLPRWIMVGLAILAFAVSNAYVKPVTYERRDDAHYLSRREFTDGTSSLGNSFSTIWTEWKKERFATRFQTNSDDSIIDVRSQAPLSYQMIVHAKKESSLSANILYFPGWKAYIDGKENTVSYQADGIIHVNMPVGEHELRIKFTETPLRRLADGVSLFSLFWLLTLVIRKRTQNI